jgi:hypothetical protein
MPMRHVLVQPRSCLVVYILYDVHLEERLTRLSQLDAVSTVHSFSLVQIILMYVSYKVSTGVMSAVTSCLPSLIQWI